MNVGKPLFILKVPRHECLPTKLLPKGFYCQSKFQSQSIENYFGKQRARSGRNENPTLNQCVYNAAALRLQKSLALDPVRGNCRRNRLSYSETKIDNTPLPKRKRK